MKGSLRFAPYEASEQDDDVGMSEEEAFHLMELQQREALYGPHHPNLADSLSNLAILYNQSGEYDKAQPLYERALQIYQTVHGPDHPDVAHTLTDLAVLHLEQVQPFATLPWFQPQNHV